MNHEKLIVQENGRKVKINVTVWLDFNKGAQYKVSLSICEKGKRIFRFLTFDGYEYRKLEM